MHRLYVIDRKQLHMICGKEMSAVERGYWINRYAERQYILNVRRSDFECLFKIVTEGHGYRYQTEYIQDIEEDVYYMRIEDMRKMKELKHRLKAYGITGIYEKLDDSGAHHKDFLRRLKDAKRQLTKALNHAIGYDKCLVYFYGSIDEVENSAD